MNWYKVVFWGAGVVAVLFGWPFLILSLVALPKAYPEDYQELARDLRDWFKVEE